MKKFILFFSLLFTINAFAQQQPTPLVSVIGEGTVTVVPDQVLMNSRVEHQGNSAAEVKSQNDKVVNEILKFLKSQGIPAKNIQTEYIRLNKEYNYNSKEYYYSANQAISVKLDDLGKYEEVMNGLLESGLNRIDGIEFKSSKKEQLESEARKKAVLDAQAKAKELVAPLDQRLGGAFNISEMETNHYQPLYRGMVEMKTADSGAAQTIAPGEMEITVKVNVSFILL
ncbi:MAG TPA: SIMPL domain-containing protein [Salinimicrobium sp.]|nr:SIMPL domain-containing protein [Salinimicrobium sp.]